MCGCCALVAGSTHTPVPLLLALLLLLLLLLLHAVRGFLLQLSHQQCGWGM
jgi:hypothetical protein